MPQRRKVVTRKRPTRAASTPAAGPNEQRAQQGASRRPLPRRGKTQTRAQAGPAAGGYTGAAGMSRVDEEIEHQEQRRAARMAQANQPFRVWMPVGTEREVIIVDEQPNFFRYEHCLFDPTAGDRGKWNLFVGCTKEVDSCPVCVTTGKESYYAMYLTVIDLSPYTDRQGITQEFSRKLLVVKSAQQRKFIRKYQQEGSLRGAIYLLIREGDKSPQIGSDQEFQEYMEEDDLLAYERQYSTQDGQTHTERCHEPYDYAELFPPVTSAELRAIVGGEPVPGSVEEQQQEFDQGDWDQEGEEDDIPFDADAEVQDEEEPEQAPRRPTPRRAKKASTRAVPTRRAGTVRIQTGNSQEGGRVRPAAGSRKRVTRR